MSGKKRGMSMDEKRSVVLDILQSSMAPWLLKDLEKAAVKRGVVLQSVKDVVTLLVSDDLVVTDKIGTSCYFWSFLSSAGNTVRTQHAKATAELAALTAAGDAAAAKLSAAKAAAPDTAERASAAAALGAARARHSALSSEAEAHAGNDPAVRKAVSALVVAGVEGANRWTENACCLDSWLRLKMEVSQADRKAFFESHGVNFDAWDNVTLQTVKESMEPKAAKKGKGGGSGGGKKRKASAAAHDDEGGAAAED